MRFMVRWTLKGDNRDRTIARFKETGGPPPSGVQMIGRWHCASGSGGFALAESGDAAAIHRWVYDWSDLLSFEVHPVLNDEEFMRSLG